MSYAYGGPKFYKIIKHKQPGIQFWQIITTTICGENYNLDTQWLIYCMGRAHTVRQLHTLKLIAL